MCRNSIRTTRFILLAATALPFLVASGTLATGQETAKKYFKPLDQVAVDVRPTPGVVPPDCSAGLFALRSDQGPMRQWGCTQFQWVAPEMFCHPLYFDDVPLERYGQTPCPAVQPLLSGAHFFTVFPLLPAKLVLDPPCRRVYTLGYYRPGSPAPCVCQRLVPCARGRRTVLGLRSLVLGSRLASNLRPKT
jgi:hypothetical protein